MTPFELSDLSDYVNIILKSVGVSFLAGICSNVCLELGKPTIAELVLLAAKLELLLLSLPLAVNVISYVSAII